MINNAKDAHYGFISLFLNKYRKKVYYTTMILWKDI